MHAFTEGQRTTSCSAECTTLCDGLLVPLRSLARLTLPGATAWLCCTVPFRDVCRDVCRHGSSGWFPTHRCVRCHLAVMASAVTLFGPSDVTKNRCAVDLSSQLSCVPFSGPIGRVGSVPSDVKKRSGHPAGATCTVKFSTTGTGSDSGASDGSNSGPGTAEPDTDTDTPACSRPRQGSSATPRSGVQVNSSERASVQDCNA